MNDKAIMKHEPLQPFGSIQQFEDAQRMGGILASSRFVPKMFRDSLPDCVMALGIASQLGANPLAVMNALYEVHGKIGFEAKFLIANVNASGRFDPIRWEFSGTEGKDDWGARAYAKDRQSGEVLKGTLVNIEMAKKEGWFGKTGSKWQTMPEQMLRYRSASFWISTYAGECAMGMRTQEDLQDEVQTTKAEVVRPVEKPKTIEEAIAVTQEYERMVPPATPFEPDPVEAPVETDEKIAEGIMKERAAELYGPEWPKDIARIMKELGIKGRLGEPEYSIILDHMNDSASRKEASE